MFPALATYTRDASGNITGLAGYTYNVHKYSNTQFTCAGRANGDNVLLDSLIIPANTLGANALLELDFQYSFPGAGANPKDPLIRIGLTSGTFATATNILNNQGLTTQKNYAATIRGHNKGAQNSNVWLPPQTPTLSGNAGANAKLDASIDFSQSVTIYLGGTCLNAFSDPTDIVRLEWFSLRITQ